MNAETREQSKPGEKTLDKAATILGRDLPVGAKAVLKLVEGLFSPAKPLMSDQAQRAERAAEECEVQTAERDAKAAAYP